MAALIGPLKGKILVQFGDSEPVEIGEIEIPVTAKLDSGGFLLAGTKTVVNDTVYPIPYRGLNG